MDKQVKGAKPCPFCGSTTLVLFLHESETETIMCNACGVMGPPVLCGMDTVKVWNERAKP